MRVVQYGCGPTGCGLVRFAHQRPDIEIVGAIDTDNSLIGHDLGEIIGLIEKLRISISGDAVSVLSQTKPDIIFLTIASYPKNTYAQLEHCLKAGANVTCEELTYPYRKYPEIDARIDEMAKASKLTLLATGVNQGFTMDTWPLFMTAVYQKVEQIKVRRIKDASTRRSSLQRKI